MLRHATLTKIIAALSLIFLIACERAEEPAPPAAPPAEEEGVREGAPEEGVVSEPLEEKAEPGTQEDLIEEVGADRVFFATDRSDLSPEARETLRKQADWLQQYPSVTVTVEGHCDERGTREYNLALGDRRANSVKNYLVALGIDASRISTVSYGKERPAVLGSNEDAWAQNRRAVLIVE